MKQQVIKLYVNEPMGKRWQNNLESARRAEKEFGAKIVIISKASPEYCAESNPPPCPSVSVDNTIIVQDGIISYEDLTTVILRSGA